MGLVLSSLSLQGTALQSKLHFRSQVQVRSDQDQLSQAAQRLVSQINLLHPCLLNLPKQDWDVLGTACIDTNQATSLIQGGDGSPADVLTLDWQPDASGQKVMLLLQLPKIEGGSGRRGLFAIHGRFRSRACWGRHHDDGRSNPGRRHLDGRLFGFFANLVQLDG
jgi:hypothetical protein